jgi:hypothetical protein
MRYVTTVPTLLLTDIYLHLQQSIAWQQGNVALAQGAKLPLALGATFRRRTHQHP